MNKLKQLRLTLKVMLRKRSKPASQKKQELWEKDLSAYQRFKINAVIKWRRFDTQTRGMGLLMVLFLGIMLVVTSLPLLIGYINAELDKEKYKDALNIACTDLQFYALNFRSCENTDVRPNAMNQTKAD